MSDDPADSTEESMRVDTWAWAVRLFKSRSLATAACRKEHVLVNGQRCRPSRRIRAGDRIEVVQGGLTRTLEVKALLAKRVGAPLVEDYLVDRTPPEVYEAARESARRARAETPQRERGGGRPTKRDRRVLDEAMNREEDESLSFEEFVRAFTGRR